MTYSVKNVSKWDGNFSFFFWSVNMKNTHSYYYNHTIYFLLKFIFPRHFPRPRKWNFYSFWEALTFLNFQIEEKYYFCFFEAVFSQFLWNFLTKTEKQILLKWIGDLVQQLEVSQWFFGVYRVEYLTPIFGFKIF